MEIPGVALYYTAQMFSIQAKCYLRVRRKHEVRTTVPLPPPLCVVHAVVAKVRLKFLYTMRTLHRLERVLETLRAALNQLSAAEAAWVRQHVPVAWYEC